MNMVGWMLVVAMVLGEPAYAVQQQGVLALRGEVTTTGPELRLADLADLSILPADLREHARSITLTRFAGNRRTVVLSEREVVARARARMPALARWLPPPAGKSISVRIADGAPDVADEVIAGSCVQAVRITAVGAVPASEDFAPAACVRGRDRALRYDRVTGSVRATRTIGAGEIVTAWAGYGGDRVNAGQVLTLTSYSGPARVERPVEALQSARPGQRLFVRSSDGVYHSVRYEAAP